MTDLAKCGEGETAYRNKTMVLTFQIPVCQRDYGLFFFHLGWTKNPNIFPRFALKRLPLKVVSTLQRYTLCCQ